ncbi:MAG: imelysin family protein [Gammaproteobacteria bacterium]|nr:imelysin family protein [Gammaproteobacteria bacterium]
MSKHLSILSGLLLSLCLSPTLAADAPTGARLNVAAVNLRIIDQQIIPGYQRLVDATQAFAHTTETGCGDQAALRNNFNGVADAWMAVEHWRFGPVEYLDRRHRLWFWPDKHSRSAKQLRALIIAADAQVLEAENFAQLSAALQGMPAIERLIFVEGEHKDYACQVLHAIATNMARMSTGIVSDWTATPDGERALITATGSGSSPLYQNPLEFTAELLQSLNTQLLTMRDLKLDRPLGDDLATARPHRAEFWRSERSLPNLHRNLAAVAQLYGVTAPGLNALILDPDSDLDTRIKAAFGELDTALHAIQPPLSTAVADAKRRPQVESARAALDKLITLITQELPPALGLNLGFNALDGD